MTNIINLEEAKNILRVDFNDDDSLIQTLIDTIPEYLKNKTGNTWNDEPINPLVKTLAKFLLQCWYEESNPQLEKTIDNIIATLTPMGRE